MMSLVAKEMMLMFSKVMKLLLVKVLPLLVLELMTSLIDRDDMSFCLVMYCKLDWWISDIFGSQIKSIIDDINGC